TQIALLGAVTAFGAAILAYLEPMISAAPASIDFSQQQPADSILVRVVLPAIAWLVVAFAIGLVGLAEARSTDDLGRRRATVTRFWAGILAVLGLATSAFRSGSLGDGTYDRLVVEVLAESRDRLAEPAHPPEEQPAIAAVLRIGRFQDQEQVDRVDGGRPVPPGQMRGPQVAQDAGEDLAPADWPQHPGVEED